MKRKVVDTGESDKSQGSYNPELDKYVGTVMCPDKVAKGREMLAKAGFSSKLLNRQVKK